MPRVDPNQLLRAAEVLKTVGHPLRLSIIQLLESGERSVTEIHQALGARQSHTSQQLSMMKAKGILSSRRAGNQTFYAIANRDVIKVIRCVGCPRIPASYCRRQSGRSRSRSSPSGRRTVRR